MTLLFFLKIATSRFNLIPLALANFRKAFALTCDDKGEFPFLLIEPANYHTTRQGLPDLRYYSVDSKTVEKKAAFLEWYNSHDDSYVFDFDRELLEYCRKDVVILALGLLEYRAAMIELTTWDPLPRVPTLASFTSHVLRCDHLPPKTLVNLPENGFNVNRQQSE